MNLYPQYCLASFIMFLFAALISAVRVVPEDHCLVIFRLGRFEGVRGPGRAILIPFIERSVAVDLREQVRSMAYDHVGREHARVDIDLEWSYQVDDPVMSILGVADISLFTEGLIRTVLRREVGDMAAVDLRTSRVWIERILEEEVGEKVKNFGVKLTKVEMVGVREKQGK